jgi:protein gp37
MNKTEIDYCDYTWNPVWGCRNNCPYCYARKIAERWDKSFEPHWMERNFQGPMPKEPSRIFVNSMSDVTYWEPEWWKRVLQRIEKNPAHTFLFLTKNPAVYHLHPFPGNCWLGATATTQKEIDSHQDALFFLDNLCFLSIEPIQKQIDPRCIEPEAINWVILGAESGNRKEKVVPPAKWIQPFLELEIPLFMKRNLPWPQPWRKEFPA